MDSPPKQQLQPDPLPSSEERDHEEDTVPLPPAPNVTERPPYPIAEALEHWFASGHVTTAISDFLQTQTEGYDFSLANNLHSEEAAHSKPTHTPVANATACSSPSQAQLGSHLTNVHIFHRYSALLQSLLEEFVTFGSIPVMVDPDDDDAEAGETVDQATGELQRESVRTQVAAACVTLTLDDVEDAEWQYAQDNFSCVPYIHAALEQKAFDELLRDTTAMLVYTFDV